MAALKDIAEHHDYVGPLTGERIGREANCPECGHICRVPTWEERGVLQFVTGFSWVTWCEHVDRASGMYFVFRGRS